MLYLTYIEPLYHSKDPNILYKSSGHIMLDIFSTFIFSFLLNAKVVYHKSWNLSKIISSKSWEKYCDKPPLAYDYEIIIDNYREWEGISFEQYSLIRKNILESSKNYNNVLVKFTNVCKIHPHRLCLWHKLNYIPNNMYSENVLPLLKNLYYFDNNDNLIDAFSIHIRRGDLYTDMIKEGFTYKYYENIINIINKYLNIKINIYCEDSNYSDIINLKKLKNTNVDIGGLNDFSRQFNELCRSKYLILSPSSFSIFTGYLSKGNVFCDIKTANWRQNIFKNLNITPNFILYSEEKMFDAIIKSLIS